MADGRSLAHEVLESHRLTAIKLYQNKVEISVITKSLGVTRQAVYGWLRQWRANGVRGLRARKALGPEPRLNEEQFKKLQKILKSPATKAGYATDLWSGPRIGHLLKHKFGTIYHAKHLPRLLRRLGLCLKFPERRALEQDPKAVRKWKRERLPDILKYAQKHKALLFYADEALVSLIPYVGTTWTFPKAQPIARVSGKRGQHVGITAAVNPQGRLCFEMTKDRERFTAKVFLRFIKKLKREYPSRSIVLIVDGARVHTAKIVKTFQRENSSWLRLEILPAYSPELNPAEKPWRFVKTKKMNASTAKNKVELRSNVGKVMRELKHQSQRIVSFF
jgi:transposase